MDWVPWLSSLGFAVLGWGIGRQTTNWYAESREAARRQMLERCAKTILAMAGFWLLAWQGLVRFGLFDLTSTPIALIMTLPMAGIGYTVAVRQHANSLFGRRLPRRLRPKLFVRR